MLGNEARSYLHVHIAVRTLIDDFSTIETFELLQPHFGHLNCIPVV